MSKKDYSAMALRIMDFGKSYSVALGNDATVPHFVKLATNFLSSLKYLYPDGSDFRKLLKSLAKHGAAALDSVLFQRLEHGASTDEDDNEVRQVVTLVILDCRNRPPMERAAIISTALSIANQHKDYFYKAS